jgi:hypothetical protein
MRQAADMMRVLCGSITSTAHSPSCTLPSISSCKVQSSRCRTHSVTLPVLRWGHTHRAHIRRSAMLTKHMKLDDCSPLASDCHCTGVGRVPGLTWPPLATARPQHLKPVHDMQMHMILPKHCQLRPPGGFGKLIMLSVAGNGDVQSDIRYRTIVPGQAWLTISRLRVSACSVSAILTCCRPVF